MSKTSSIKKIRINGKVETIQSVRVNNDGWLTVTVGDGKAVSSHDIPANFPTGLSFITNGNKYTFLEEND